jgi:hypothetical protein
MLKLKCLLLFFVASAFVNVHKYYVSVTEINIIESSGTIQISSRLFIDDLELALQNIYADESITLSNADSETVRNMMETYVKSHFKITANKEQIKLNYLGREYEDDVVYIYMEAEVLYEISSIKISNSILFETYKEQEHIIKTKTEKKSKSFILNKSKPFEVLNI